MASPVNLFARAPVYADVNDAYLIGSIANGDAEAVRPLIERYQKPLAAVLQRALGSSPDVDDVFQETWMRVIRSAHRYDPEQRFSAWLFAIAWNLVKDRWARRPPLVGMHRHRDLWRFRVRRWMQRRWGHA